jgi:excisionase family DNA binding protein
MSTLPESAWLTATEAANYLRIEPRTLLMWARQGKVKGYVLSGTRRVTWRFLRSDLDATLRAPAVLSTTGGLNERTA